MRHLYFALLFTGMLGANKLLPQSLQKKLTQVDGLSSYNIRSIVKDPNGIVWICTQDGLSRYNGASFTNYSKDGRDQRSRIDFTDCRSMYIDSFNNRLWVLGSTGSLNVIDCITGNITERYYRPPISGDDWSVTMEKIGNELWIGSTQGLWIFDLKTLKFKAVPLKSNQKEIGINRINTLKEDKYANVWVFVNEVGAYIINPKSKKVLYLLTKDSFGPTDAGFEFTSSVIISDTLILGTNHGLRTYSYSNNYVLQPIKLPKDLGAVLDSNSISNITSYRNNKILICSKQFVQISTNFLSYTILNNASERPDSWLSEIYSICPIADSLLVIGCNSGVAIYDLTPKPILPIINNEQFFKNKLKHVYSIYHLTNKHILTGTEFGLFEISNTALIKTIDSTDFYQNISAIDTNELIVSGRRGLRIYANQTLRPLYKVYAEFTPYLDWAINSCKKYGKDLYVLGTENDKGILLWNKAAGSITRLHSESSPVALLSDNVNVVFVDSLNRIWILSDFDISILEQSRNKLTQVSTILAENNKSLGLYFDMVSVNDQYWIAAYGNGIIILDKNLNFVRKITTNDGLCNNGVYKIYSQQGSVFVSSNNGFSKINALDYSCKNFSFPLDRLHGNSFEETTGEKINGKIYFGGLDGITEIDPALFKPNKNPPQLYFQEIEIASLSKTTDTLNLHLKDLSIPNDYLQAKIFFVGINYKNPERIKYKYRIKELQNQWIDLKNQNFLTLIGIAPGTYTLEVKAANEDDVECKPISMQLHFLAKWYQTWLFKIAVGLAIAGLLYILYAFRIRQLKKVFSVRQKISSDLHDDIGSTLSTINMYSQIAQLQPNQPGYANTIQENTQDVLEKLDDIVWATNPKNDKVQNLAERIDGFARPLLQAQGIQFVFNAHDSIGQQNIGTATRQNLFLICKEAVNNTAKYSQCKTSSITLYIKNKYIHCTISDDGIGFDTKLPTERNGLNNMQLRAKAIKGKIEITSSPGSGTKINMQFPL